MSAVVIFGNRDFASLAHFYLKREGLRVSAFTVHGDYIEGETFEKKPVVPFEQVSQLYPPEEYKMFAPVNYQNSNPFFRQDVYCAVKGKGYSFVSYVSPKATVFGSVGENCFILEDNTIQPFVKIGDNCVLWSGNHIGHHSIIEDHALFTSHVVLSGHCHVRPHTFLGVNSTVRDGTTIEQGCVIGMGSLVTKDTAPWGVYLGSPAKRYKDVPHVEETRPDLG